MSTAIGVISLILWFLCIKSGLDSYKEDDIDGVFTKEWFSIAYLAIAAWCFH